MLLMQGGRIDMDSTATSSKPNSCILFGEIVSTYYRQIGPRAFQLISHFGSEEEVGEELFFLTPGS